MSFVCKFSHKILRYVSYIMRWRANEGFRLLVIVFALFYAGVDNDLAYMKPSRCG